MTNQIPLADQSNRNTFLTLDETTASPSNAPASSNPAIAPYATRKINVTFALGTGDYGQGKPTTFTLVGLRVVVHIELANMPTTGAATVRIYGMTLDHMNQASQAGLLWKARYDDIRIDAGDDITGMNTVFVGKIIEAYPDMRSQPEVSFYVYATPSNIAQLKPIEPSSFTGPTKAADAMESIAKKAGFTFENNGVTAVLAYPYYQGTAWDQLLSAVRAADCFGYYDGVTNKFTIWPKTGGTNKSGEIIVSPETGMIGYPIFQVKTVIVRRLYDNKTIKVNDTIQVKSQLKAANGRFKVITQTYDLSSELPDGPWEMTMICYPADG